MIICRRRTGTGPLKKNAAACSRSLTITPGSSTTIVSPMIEPTGRNRPRCRACRDQDVRRVDVCRIHPCCIKMYPRRLADGKGAPTTTVLPLIETEVPKKSSGALVKDSKTGVCVMFVEPDLGFAKRTQHPCLRRRRSADHSYRRSSRPSYQKYRPAKRLAGSVNVCD